MRYIIFFCLLFFVYSFLLNNSHGNYKFSTSENKIINQLSFAINKHLNGKSLKERENFSKRIDALQEKNKNLFEILEQVKKNTFTYNYQKKQLDNYNKHKINIDLIEKSWLSFHNHERKQLSLGELNYSKYLNNTSYEWSKNQDFLGEMTHKRLANDIFYNHNSVENWFQNRGIKCKPISRISVTESVAKYSYFCNKKDDCTQELINSIREIFLIYMSEKGLKYPEDAHYRAIVHPDLKKIGLGIHIKETDHKNLFEYYLTSHYCTEILN